MTKIVSTNPAKNYEVVGEVEISTDAEIARKVAAANDARRAWKELGVQKRAEWLKPVCEDFASRAQEMANLITAETGKALGSSNGEVRESVSDFQWFLENAAGALADEVTHEDEESVHKIVYEPFGTAAVITPWNYPLDMAIWGIVPNLLAGNTVVFKISEECPLVGALIEEVFGAHGLPDGVFSVVHGGGDVGEKLARSAVDLIWFTGSSGTGHALYQIAAEKFIKAVLEMGGSNPCIVFEDASVQEAAERIYAERFGNCGQVCDSIKRLIVHESLYEKMVDALKGIAASKKVGDPADPETDLGSLVARRQAELIQAQVQDAVDKGAAVVAGGKAPQDLQGAFFEPTLLTNVTRDMRVWKEETFGPVLPVVKFSTEDEAVELANDTVYGLGSRVFSADAARAQRVASRIAAGSVEVNYASRWLSCNPFGGYKRSGMGREHGTVGFRELCQIKVVSAQK